MKTSAAKAFAVAAVSAAIGLSGSATATAAGLPLETMTPTEYDQIMADDIDASFGSFRFTGPPECWFRPISGRAMC